MNYPSWVKMHISELFFKINKKNPTQNNMQQQVIFYYLQKRRY